MRTVVVVVGVDAAIELSVQVEISCLGLCIAFGPESGCLLECLVIVQIL